MTLTLQIARDAEDALRSKDAFALGALRLLRSALLNAEKEVRHPLSDEEATAVVWSEVKKIRDSLPQFQAGGRADLVDKTEREMALLSKYLPAQMTEEEIRAAVKAKVTELGAGPEDVGKVTGVLMKELRGKADGGAVSAIVREILNAKS